MVKFGIMRHARTHWNLEKKMQGRKNLALCRQGMAEAEAWGTLLKPEKFDLILSSPLLRARQTADILSEKIGIGIDVDDNLREQDFGLWEGKKLSDIRKQDPGTIEAQESKGWAFCPPCGEARRALLNRALTAMRKAGNRYEGYHVLVVTHNSVIKSILYHLMDRLFLPEESQVLREYHLHGLVWKEKLEIEKLNRIWLQS